MTPDIRQERNQYNWIKWLQDADPDSDLLQREAAIIEDLHPDWTPATNPYQGISIWPMATETGVELNPDSLLSKPASYWAPDLGKIGWQNPQSLTPPIHAIEMAVRRNPTWGIELASEWIQPEPKETPVWGDIINGWNQSDLTEEQQSTVLNIVGDPAIQLKHGDLIADHLYNLVKFGGKPYAYNLLGQAEAVARSLWEHIESDTPPESNESWVEHATSFYGVGYLPLFWTNAASIRIRHQEDFSLNDGCRQSLRKMISQETIQGFLAQSVIAGQTAFLLKADEGWTLENVMPLFEKSSGQQAAAVWEGFAAAQNIDQPTAEYLGSTVHQQLPRIAQSLSTDRDRMNLARCYSSILCYYAADPKLWLKETVRDDDNMAILTTTAIQHRLRQADPVQQKDWWSRWLKDYWQDRILGAPRPLSNTEANELISWAPYLPAVNMEAAQMAAATQVLAGNRVDR